MNLDATDELIDAWELVTYAKAAFSNLELLRAFEALPPRVVSADPTSVTTAAHAFLKTAYVQGRFSQMKRLQPELTDEAIENRIARVSKNIDSAAAAGAPVAGANRATHAALSDHFDQDLPDLLTALARTFLCEGNDRSIRVKARLLSPWQDLVLVVPPLLITSTWIAERIALPGLAEPVFGEHQQISARMRAWLCESTLPVDDDPFIDYLCRTEGLDETHMHLNGTTEAEKIWFDALERPRQVVGALTAKIIKKDGGLRIATGNGVKRLLHQEDASLTPAVLLQRVEAAVVLKVQLLHFSLRRADTGYEPGADESAGTAYRLVQAACLQHAPLNQVPRVVREAWQLVAIMQALQKGTATPEAGVAFWHYVLLRAQFCRLLVQQADQKGFDQFQYITLNELRENTEKDYAERFRQIERGHQKGVDFVEGRFAPKPTPNGNADLIGRVLRGYLEFLGESEAGQGGVSRPVESYRSLAELLRLVRVRENGSDAVLSSAPQSAGAESRSPRRLRLGLVPHFIKSADADELKAFAGENGLRPACRHAALRRKSDQSARALVALIQRTTGLDSLIRGVDAASNERHAGPEVFAPVFRRMRDAGIRRFTYHAGEDFVHLMSGLRAITEAVVFLDFDAGCRIGHGTASGLDPKRWWGAVGGYVVMPMEDRLDDLVLARDLLLQARVHAECLPSLDAEINRLSMRIWNDPSITPEVLADAWKLRSLDPLVQNVPEDYFDLGRRREALLFAEACARAPKAHAHFLRRHGRGATSAELQRGREDIRITRENEVLKPTILSALQEAVLLLLHRRGIAIETLPSSNVRISIHKAYEDHHVRQWLGLDGKSSGKCVSVVVGSDDPGIFATGLRMEYAHLFRILHAGASAGGAMNKSKAENLLHSICVDAKRYRF